MRSRTKRREASKPACNRTDGAGAGRTSDAHSSMPLGDTAVSPLIPTASLQSRISRSNSLKRAATARSAPSGGADTAEPRLCSYPALSHAKRASAFGAARGVQGTRRRHSELHGARGLRAPKSEWERGWGDVQAYFQNRRKTFRVTLGAVAPALHSPVALDKASVVAGSGPRVAEPNLLSGRGYRTTNPAVVAFSP